MASDTMQFFFFLRETMSFKTPFFSTSKDRHIETSAEAKTWE